MTEGKPKRSYWRRGPRKKKGAEDAAGTAAATPPVTEGGDPAPESEATGSPDTGESFAPPAPEFAEEAAESAPGEMEAGSAPTAEVPPKGRRRSRRRGKKKPGDAPAPESTEGAGEAQRPGGGIPAVRGRGVGGTGVARRATVPGPGGTVARRSRPERKRRT